jgi:hypothetical protein
MPIDEDALTTQDIYEQKARMLVEQLIEKGIIKMEHDKPILYHVPTGTQFDSVENMAHFHMGWEAAQIVET